VCYTDPIGAPFVIGPDGTLEKIMRRVKPETHADDVLATLGGG